MKRLYEIDYDRIDIVEESIKTLTRETNKIEDLSITLNDQDEDIQMLMYKLNDITKRIEALERKLDLRKCKSITEKEAYEKCTGLTFREACVYLEKGISIRRKGWFTRISNKYSEVFIVDVMQNDWEVVM